MLQILFPGVFAIAGAGQLDLAVIGVFLRLRKCKLLHTDDDNFDTQNQSLLVRILRQGSIFILLQHLNQIAATGETIAFD